MDNALAQFHSTQSLIVGGFIWRLKMADNFKKCLEIILENEGGFADHPRDPGGMTNLGVT